MDMKRCGTFSDTGECTVLLAERQGRDVARLLRRLDCRIIPVRAYDEIFGRVLEENPALIIGDFDGMGRPVHQICRELKNHVTARHIPLIVVTKNGAVQDRIAAAESGATDYIVKPFERKEVLARINRIIRDMRYALNANPLTRLPGNIAIQENIARLLELKQPFAVLYFDIDHFKSYNDLYGYTAGDRVISMAAGVLLRCREEIGGLAESSFVGHVGGDDFIMICPEESAEAFCRRYITRFDCKVPGLYDRDTAKRGFVIGRDRRGKVASFPLISVSIAAVVNERGGKFRHVGEIASAGAEIKAYLKNQPGSSYLIDRRR
jgi:GGDEF domain-containing protein